MDKLMLNKQVVSMRQKVRQAKVHVTRELIKKMKRLREKFPEKVKALDEQVAAVKKIKNDDVSKFALENTKSLSQAMSNGVSLDAEGKVLIRLATHKVVVACVKTFRDRFPNWEKEVPLLMKVLGVKSRNKKHSKKETNSKKESSFQDDSAQRSKRTSSSEEESDDDDDSDDASENESEVLVTKDAVIRDDNSRTAKPVATKSKPKITTAKEDNEKAPKPSPKKETCSKISRSKPQTVLLKKKRPCFVVTDKVCGTSEVRKLRLEQLEYEEIPVNSITKQEKVGEEESSEKPEGPQDSFFLREDGESIDCDRDGEDDEDDMESTYEGRKGSYRNQGNASVDAYPGGLNRRQRRNLMFGRDSDDRQRSFSKRSQASSQANKHFSKFPSSHSGRPKPGRRFFERTDGYASVKKSVPEIPSGKESASEALHPSWAAKRKLNQQTVSTFQGKKIKFDDE